MRRAVISGLSVAIVGAGIVWIASGYPLGSLTRMGPGFFPIIMGSALLVLAVLITASEWRSDGETLAGDIRLRPLLVVAAGLLAWTLIVPRLGLVPGTVVLVAIVSLAQSRPSLVYIVVTSLFLSAFGVLVFIEGLGVRFVAFRF